MLEFVVEETLAGRGERIKAFTIATEVFGRGEDFDAQGNALVGSRPGGCAGCWTTITSWPAATTRSRSASQGGYQPAFARRPPVEPPGGVGEPPQSLAPGEAAAVGPAVHEAPPPRRHHRFHALMLVASGLGLLIAAGAWLALSPARETAAVGEPALASAPFRPSVLVLRSPICRHPMAAASSRTASATRSSRCCTVPGNRRDRPAGAPAPTGGTDPQLPAADIGATHLLEGSVAATADRMRISVLPYGRRCDTLEPDLRSCVRGA